MRIFRSSVTPVLRTHSQSQHDLFTHFVFLPGNPGVIEYYRLFMQAFWFRLQCTQQQQCCFHALGLPGHDLRQLNGDREFVISDHVAFCLSYFRSEKMSPSLSESALIFIGHSYGSFLALKIIDGMTSTESANVRLVMLMPCLWKMGHCAGIWIRLILSDLMRIFSWLAWLLTVLTPPIVRDSLVSIAISDSHAGTVSKKLGDGQRRAVYANITSLGRDEMRLIRYPHDLRGIKRLLKPSLLVYVDNDKWCPSFARKAIIDAFGEHAIDSLKANNGVTHAFVLDKQESQAIVDLILPWFCDQVFYQG